MALHGLDDTNKSRVVLQTAHLSLMREQADRMQRLINDLLTLSRLETGGSDKTLEVFSLSDLVETIAEEISVMAAKTHTVKTDIAASIWITGYCDEIRSAIVNLMTNAVRYTPAGGTIRLVCTVREDGAIIVSVADNGIGIAQKDIPRLTERFYRVDKSRSRETGRHGSGTCHCQACAAAPQCAASDRQRPRERLDLYGRFAADVPRTRPGGP